MVKTPISKSKISIHIKFSISLSVLHPRVHLRHHRQSERHDAQPRCGINEENVFFLSFVETQVTYTAVQNTDLFCWDYGVESVLSYLPLSHVAGQMMDVFLIMSKVLETLLYFINGRCLNPPFKGGTCCFADKNALRGTLLENIKHYRPSRLAFQNNKTLEIFCHVDQIIARFVGVPRVFEKIEEGMKAAGAKSGLKKRVRQKI